MVDIVIRALTQKEAHDLRVLKAELGERNWRTMFLHVLEKGKGLGLK